MTTNHSTLSPSRRGVEPRVLWIANLAQRSTTPQPRTGCQARGARRELLGRRSAAPAAKRLFSDEEADATAATDTSTNP